MIASRILTMVAIAAMPVLAQAAPKAAAPPAEPAEAAAPPAVEKPAPYDGRLLRMAEVLGSVHYLRNLCNGPETKWRDAMSAFLKEETGNEPGRAAILRAAFNRGYRSFAATYTKCTPQAVAAEARYRTEGASLVTEITARFGN